MAKKRMFSLGVLETDAFMDMPLSAQALYFHLNLRADDDGFVGNPKRITTTIGANMDDLKLLVAKRFVIAFDDGVIVIKHWRMHNAIKKDRYTQTNYIEDLKMLQIKENGAYTLSGAQLEHKWSTDGEQMSQTCSADKVSIGKDRLGKDSKDNSNRKRFTKPTLQELSDYISEKKLNVDPQQFMDYYDSNGWKVGRNPMKDWKATVRRWNSTQNTTKKANYVVPMPDYMTEEPQPKKKPSEEMLAEVLARQKAMKY